MGPGLFIQSVLYMTRMTTRSILRLQQKGDSDVLTREKESSSSILLLKGPHGRWGGGVSSCIFPNDAVRNHTVFVLSETPRAQHSWHTTRLDSFRNLQYTCTKAKLLYPHSDGLFSTLSKERAYQRTHTVIAMRSGRTLPA